jgi:hypothetical protein
LLIALQQQLGTNAPGLIVFTRMPRSFRSLVHPRANDRTAALLAEYTLTPGLPLIDSIEAFSTIELPFGWSPSRLLLSRRAVRMKTSRLFHQLVEVQSVGHGIRFIPTRFRRRMELCAFQRGY